MDWGGGGLGTLKQHNSKGERQTDDHSHAQFRARRIKTAEKNAEEIYLRTTLKKRRAGTSIGGVFDPLNPAASAVGRVFWRRIGRANRTPRARANRKTEINGGQL